MSTGRIQICCSPDRPTRLELRAYFSHIFPAHQYPQLNMVDFISNKKRTVGFLESSVRNARRTNSKRCRSPTPQSTIKAKSPECVAPPEKVRKTSVRINNKPVEADMSSGNGKIIVVSRRPSLLVTNDAFSVDNPKTRPACEDTTARLKSIVGEYEANRNREAGTLLTRCSATPSSSAGNTEGNALLHHLRPSPFPQD